MSDRSEKITFAQMRGSGVRGLLIYCTDFNCSHSIAISGDPWPDDVRLSEIEPRIACRPAASFAPTCGPDFNWNVQGPIGGMGYR